MRRLVTLIIMLIVPLQIAWAAAVGTYGHAGNDVAAIGFHMHGHDHHDCMHADHAAPHDTASQDHGEDGHHCHTHHVFSSMLAEPGLPLDEAVPGGPILYPPAAFLSRTPPLLDRPPLARA